MQCLVYRSSLKQGLYVYVLNDAALAAMPEPVRRQLGTPELALSFELTAERTLGSEDPVTVMANLESQGFHLQMPRDIERLLARAFNP